MRVSYTITDDNITLFYKSKIFSIPSSSSRFAELKEHLKLSRHDASYIESIVSIRSMIERFTQGNVKIYDNEVHYKGMPVINSLAERLVQLIDDGFEVTPWVNFMENVMLNPSDDSRDRLFTFLEKNKSPITEDGHFIGFKRIRPDWTDIYTGRIDNSVGNIVEMPRNLVDDNNQQTCSTGLHVAASIYLDTGPTQFTDTTNSRTIVVKVNPRDVVAVPPDYHETKMRTCRYEVLSEVEVGQIKEVENQNIYGDAPLRKSFTEETKNTYVDTVGEDEPEEVNDELTFVRGDTTFTKTQVLDGVAKFGSIAKWAKSFGIPRSTAQDWVKKIINS